MRFASRCGVTVNLEGLHRVRSSLKYGSNKNVLCTFREIMQGIKSIVFAIRIASYLLMYAFEMNALLFIHNNDTKACLGMQGFLHQN